MKINKFQIPFLSGTGIFHWDLHYNPSDFSNLHRGKPVKWNPRPKNQPIPRTMPMGWEASIRIAFDNQQVFTHIYSQRRPWEGPEDEYEFHISFSGRFIGYRTEWPERMKWGKWTWKDDEDQRISEGYSHPK